MAFPSMPRVRGYTRLTVATEHAAEDLLGYLAREGLRGMSRKIGDTDLHAVFVRPGDRDEAEREVRNWASIYEVPLNTEEEAI